MKDYWTEGYEAPCRSNNFQSNRPSAFGIDLHHSSEPQLNWWHRTTIKELAEARLGFRKRELQTQLRSVLAEFDYRGISPEIVETPNTEYTP